jgi:hypothetical protein
MCGGIHPAMGSYAAAIQDDLTFEMTRRRSLAASCEALFNGVD